MGPLAQFIIALTNLVRSGAIRKIPQAIKFAEQQFGKVTPLLKKQIEKVFDSAKKPAVGKPGKKEGTVIPMVRKIAEKKEEGIASLEDSSPLMDRLEKDVETVKQEFLNPKRPGGSLDPATGLTRALARRILDKKGIEIGKKDPIDVFSDTFGESINDVNNLAEEMLEIDSRGGGMKDMDQMLEIEGLFDIEIPKNPQRGLTDQEMLELEKQVTDEKILTDFDPKGRKPSATGGRAGFSIGGKEGIMQMASVDDPFYRGGEEDEHSFRMFNKPYKELNEDELEEFREEMMRLMNKFAGLTETDYLKVKDMLDHYHRYKAMPQRKGSKTKKIPKPDFAKEFFRENNATGGRVRAASGGLADILKL